MCFSAGASFGAGVILSGIGYASLQKAENKSEKFFASIPLIFSVQQITEGFVWLSLTKPEFAFLQQFTTYTFLFIAQVIWPFWVPLSILLVEKNEKRKLLLKVFLAIGITISIYLAFCLATFYVEVKATEYHISYLQKYPKQFSLFGATLYVIVTVFSPFYSSNKNMWLLGTAIFISYIISHLFYREYIVSVWCFFASIISVAVYAVLYQMHNDNNEHDATQSTSLNFNA